MEDINIEELNEAVSVSALKQKGFAAPLPQSVRVLPSIDHTGETSLDVIVVFPPDIPDSEMASPKTGEMLSWIQDTLLSKVGSGHWPYVFVRTHDKDLCPT